MELAGIISSSGKTAAAKTIIETYASARDMKILYPSLSLKTPEHFWIEYCAQLMCTVFNPEMFGCLKRE